LLAEVYNPVPTDSAATTTPGRGVRLPLSGAIIDEAGPAVKAAAACYGVLPCAYLPADLFGSSEDVAA
jgi:hypothetical protein